MTQEYTPSAKTLRSLEETDRMDPALRQCVHEYGTAIVTACLLAGVKRPNSIHQLVREIWEGARTGTQTRERCGTLDWLLLQAGAQIGAATLLRVLANNNLAIVPYEPTRAMVAASAAEVSDFTQRITKADKHRKRLTAAIAVGMKELRPKLLASTSKLSTTEAA